MDSGGATPPYPASGSAGEPLRRPGDREEPVASPRQALARIALLGILAGLFGLSILAKRDLGRGWTFPGHGDTNYYLAVARNLSLGRGFTVDIVWKFHDPPASVHHASHDYWMPLASIAAAASMVLRRGDPFDDARLASILLVSLTILLAFPVARLLFGGLRVPLLAVVLLLLHPYFAVEAAGLTSQAPYGLTACLAMLSLGLATRHRWGYLATGAAMALAELSRKDGGLLWATILICILFLEPWKTANPATRRGTRWRCLGLVLLGYLLFMVPWWIRNALAFGNPFPGGFFQRVWATNWEDLYALPERVSAGRYFAQGLGTILMQKLVTFLGCLRNLYAFSLFPAPFLLAVPFAFPLLRRKPWAPFPLHFGILLLAYTAVFTPLGDMSLSLTLGAFLPFEAALLAAGLDRVIALASGAEDPPDPPEPGPDDEEEDETDPAEELGPEEPLTPRQVRRRRMLATALVAIVTSGLMLAQHQESRERMRRKVLSTTRSQEDFDRLRAWLLRDAGPPPVVLTRSPWELHWATGVPAVMIPWGPLEDVVAVARHYGARYLIADPKKRPETAPSRLGADPRFRHVFDTRFMRVYEIVE